MTTFTATFAGFFFASSRIFLAVFTRVALVATSPKEELKRYGSTW